MNAENSAARPVAVVVGATSKWQAAGRNTLLAHGGPVADDHLDSSARWGVGGAIALKFAAQGYFVVLTTRQRSNAQALQAAVAEYGHGVMTVELDLTDADSITAAMTKVQADAGVPDVVVLNAGYLEGRDLPPDQELLEYIPVEMFDTAQNIASRGPFLLAKVVLPAMRERGTGSFLITNNAASLRGRKRRTGQSLYYPRVMMRALAQVLTEEYSQHGIHVANVVVDGLIDSPGTRALPVAEKRPELIMKPAAIADAFYYLHTQDRSCWTHELQLTPYSTNPSY
ncbi:MAG: SDR family oxidoreductase [Pseudomonadota bacterium]